MTTTTNLTTSEQAELAQKYLRHREKQNAYRRKHYANNKENICKKSQENYAKNKERNRQRAKEYYQKNKEKKRQYYLDNRNAILARRKKTTTP